MNINRSGLDKNSWDEIQVDGWFKGLLPPSWEIEDDGEVVMYDPDGFGEIRLGFFSNKGKKSKKERARQIIDGWKEELDYQGDDEISVLKRNRDLIAVSTEFVANEPDGEMSYWRIIPLIGNKVSLDISYNCPLEDRDREQEIIDGIIDSIRLTEPTTSVNKVILKEN